MKSPVATRSQPPAGGVGGMLPTPPLGDISHSMVLPVIGSCHSTSWVPSPLKSPEAIKIHGAVIALTVIAIMSVSVAVPSLVSTVSVSPPLKSGLPA